MKRTCFGLACVLAFSLFFTPCTHAAGTDNAARAAVVVHPETGTVLYEKIYRGVPTQGGGLRLLAYYERRIPLAHMQMELRAVGHEKEWKGAA